MRNISLLVAGICTAVPLTASNVVASEWALEEVVVTARKRGDQSIQDISGSIQALGSEDLEKAVTEGFGDYARLVPSLQILDSGGGQSQIAMRGIFPARINHAQPQARSTAAIYFDEVAVTSAGFNPDVGLVDLDRIEVLRGPQGTLYGASSMSGAIRVIPKSPDLEELSGELGFNVGDTQDGSESYSFTGALNLPLSETFALRGAAYSVNKGGYIDNVYSGEDDYNDEQSYGARLIGLWQPTDSISIKPMVVYHNLEADGRPDQYIPGDLAVTVGASRGASLVAPGEDISQFTITDELQTSKVNDDPFEDEFAIFGLTVGLDYDWGTITSVTSYMDREFLNNIDDNQRARDANGATNAATGQPITGFARIVTDSQNFAQELRVSSPSDASIEWIAGIYYEDQEREFDQSSLVPGLEAHFDAFGIPGWPGLSNLYGADLDYQFQGFQTIDTTQLALFGEVVIPLGEKLSLTAGLRWYDYEQETFLRFRGIPNGGVSVLDQSVEEDGVNPKVAISYDYNEDTMLYASAARGFRLGSLNEPVPTNDIFFPGFSCAAADPNNLNDGVTTLEDLGFNPGVDLDPVESDTVDTYEIGSKMTFADGRARVNAAVYYTEWEDIPTIITMTCGYSVILNASQVISQGFELESTFQATESLRLGFNAAYTNSELDKDSEFLGAKAGARTPFTPEWNINGSFDFSRPSTLLGAQEWYISGNVSYISNQFSSFAELGSERRVELPSTTTANLFVGLVADSWEASLYVKNLTDEEILTGVDYDRRQPTHFTRARPRTIGANFKYRF